MILNGKQVEMTSDN